MGLNFKFLRIIMCSESKHHSTSLEIAKKINNLWKIGRILTPKGTWEYMQRFHPEITITGSRRIHRIALPDMEKLGGGRRNKK